MRSKLLLFYITGSILVTIPLIFIKKARLLLVFKFSFEVIIFLITILFIVMLLEFLTFTENDEINLKRIEIIFGVNLNIPYIFLICLFAAYFEEFLFRGYSYILLKNILQLFIKNPLIINIIVTIIISLIFGILHITQGIKCGIFSFLASVIFFISMIISNTIIYAIFAHFLFNFIELTIIIPYQRKKLCN